MVHVTQPVPDTHVSHNNGHEVISVPTIIIVPTIPIQSNNVPSMQDMVNQLQNYANQMSGAATQVQNVAGTLANGIVYIS